MLDEKNGLYGLKENANLARPQSIARPGSTLNPRDNHRIIIGVDYGTTYTGISYIDSATNATNCSINDVHDVRTYPGLGREGDSVWKTPSRIAYSSENAGIETNQFGFQVLPKMVSYSWTKLLLDQNSRASHFDDPSLKQTEGQGMLRLPQKKTAVQVVSDFLREIYSWIIDYLEKRISTVVLEVTPMEFWFTVPAIWSDQAKSATITAAMQAGFASRDHDRIFLIPEPEAAGIATLKGLSEGKSAAAVVPGEGILICDCGGGTVDITSYKIKRVSPKLEFEELVEGTGGKCGSTYIDREFHRWMSRTFGVLFDKLGFERIGPGSHFMKDFEMHKRDFGYSPKSFNLNLDQVSEIRLVIPGAHDSEFYDSDESVVKLPGRIMLSFFSPVIQTILDLLAQQVDLIYKARKRSKLKRVILAGGFGDSPYLHHKVKEWCTKMGMVALCPADPQAAISRGAALRGLECVEPIRRRSRRYYGFLTQLPFREGIDPEELAVRCDWTGTKLCHRRMEWAISKGQMIDEDTKIISKRLRKFISGTSPTLSTMLYSCSMDVPPDYQWDPAVETVAELTHTVDKKELKNCEMKVIEGVKCWKLEYERQIYMGNKQGTLMFKVDKDGNEWGSSEIKYDNTSSWCGCRGSLWRESIGEACCRSSCEEDVGQHRG